MSKQGSRKKTALEPIKPKNSTSTPSAQAPDYKIPRCFRFEDEVRGDIEIQLSIPSMNGDSFGVRQVVSHHFFIEDPEKLMETYRQAKFRIAAGELEEKRNCAEMEVWRVFCTGVSGYEPAVAADFKEYFLEGSGRRHAIVAASLLADRAMIKEVNVTRPLSH